MVTDIGENGRESKTRLSRRRFTLGVLIASATGAFASLFALLNDLVPGKKGGGYVATTRPGDRLVYANGDNAGAPLRAFSFKVGDAVLAFPDGKSSNPSNLVQVIKLEEAKFAPPTRLDLTDQGFVAYSAICTHLGCTVSWDKNKQVPAASLTECPCHNSIFDPARGAKVLGGPAPIPLAQIGVKVAKDGSLVFTSDFTGPIGPQVS
jgi:rieske iron-sulfur protein